MKILHVLNHFLPNQNAGTEIYTWALCKQLQQFEIELKVVIPNYGEDVSKTYFYDNIEVFQYAESTIINREVLMGFRKPNGLLNFIDFLKEEKPDIVHFHEISGSNGIGIHHVEATKKLGCKVMMTIHLASYTCKTGILIDSNNNNCDGQININKCSNCYLKEKGIGKSRDFLVKLSALFLKLNLDTLEWRNSLGTALGTANLIKRHKENFQRIFHSTDKVICITSWYKEILILNGFESEKIKVIQQGLPFDNNFKVVDKVKRNTDSVKLLYLGRITKVKGLHLLIEALKKIENKSVELNIYGQGDGTNYEQELRIITRSMMNVKWHGVIGQNEVLNIMNRHDLLCLCSTICEMSPLVIQEARKAKLPVLASDVYGNIEQLKNGKGFLFETNNANSLYLQLRSLISEKHKLDDVKKRIQQPLRFDQIAIKYLHEYKKLLVK
jgi:glycosyltransferase involved in cell wall biosynthesis